MDHRFGNLMTQMCIECLPHGIKQLEEFGISQHILIECFCEGNHVYDYVFKRFIKMYNSMKCKNTKMVYLTLLAKNVKRSIISKNVQFICETANTKWSEVINGYKSHVYKREDILRHEQTIAKIIELNNGIPGFDNDEIKDILYYISSI